MVAGSRRTALLGARTLVLVSTQVTAHPQLGGLQQLVGAWRGSGRGRWGSGRPFEYRESVDLSHTGKAFLHYMQRTTSPEGEPMHTECGYWRALPDGSVELVLAHGMGVVEVETGRWHGGTLRLRTLDVRTTPAAKAVTALERDVEVSGDTLRYELRMSTAGDTPAWHLSAELQRIR